MKMPQFSLLICLVLVNVSCKDLIEPSLNKRVVTLKAPGSDYKSKVFAINFWWGEVEDALQYRLQVVSPSFDHIGSFFTDTLISGNKFTISLAPGDYEWQVQAMNGSSSTRFSLPRHFSVLPSSIKQQTVQLIGPGDFDLTKLPKIDFHWNSVYGASVYRLQLDTTNFSDTTNLVFNLTVSGQVQKFTFPNDATYQWRVRAENDTAKSKWSAVRTVTYDHTPPSTPNLTAPAQRATVSIPVELKWEAVRSAVTYKLYLYKSDSTTIFSKSFPRLINRTSYTLTGASSGTTLFWKVAAIDPAGNEGIASDLKSFLTQ